jgi:hypothetical protein
MLLSTARVITTVTRYLKTNPDGFTEETTQSENRQAQAQEADETQPPQEAFAL